tara:strand:- start:3030 stop:3158 length:129 start_codon:yes stop_codon:yes gene_type:complete
MVSRSNNFLDKLLRIFGVLGIILFVIFSAFEGLKNTLAYLKV